MEVKIRERVATLERAFGKLYRMIEGMTSEDSVVLKDDDVAGALENGTLMPDVVRLEAAIKTFEGAASDLVKRRNITAATMVYTEADEDNQSTFFVMVPGRDNIDDLEEMVLRSVQMLLGRQVDQHMRMMDLFGAVMLAIAENPEAVAQEDVRLSLAEGNLGAIAEHFDLFSQEEDDAD